MKIIIFNIKSSFTMGLICDFCKEYDMYSISFYIFRNEIPSNDYWDVTNLEKAYTGKNRKLMAKLDKSETTVQQKFLLLDIVSNTAFLPFSNFFRKQKNYDVSKNWTDPIFPPTTDSLLQLDQFKESSKDVEPEEKAALQVLIWKRPIDIFRSDNYYLYNTIDMSDVKQGELGNCYFLSVLSALAEYPSIYDNIFLQKEKSQNNCYCVKLYIRGIPKIVSVDDYFPCHRPQKGSGFALAYTGSNEIWVQILEKAWAKVNGSYAATIAGLPSEAFSTLTEAPCISYIHKKYKEDELWDILIKTERFNYFLCTSTGGNEDAKAMGLVRSHAYSLTDFQEYDISGRKQLRLVKLRNPWGQLEWKGPFSDTSDSWNIIPNLKAKAGVQNKDDGFFFMEFSDFLKYYPYTFLCKYRENFKYTCQKIKQETTNHMTCAKFILTKKTSLTVGLHQKQQRFYSKVGSSTESYKLQMARIILAKFNPQARTYTFIKSDSNTQDKLYIEADDLEPGEYHIFANVHWPYKTISTYTVSIYAPEQVDLLQLERETVPNDYLQQILKSYIEKKCPKQKASSTSTIQLSTGDNDLGFFMLMITNNSPTEAINFRTEVEYANCLFVSDELVTKRDKSMTGQVLDSVSTVINPNYSQVLCWKLLANPWEAQINIKNFNVVGQKPTLLKDPMYELDRKLIQNYIGQISSESLNIDCDYLELEVENGVLVIIQNKSTIDYMFKLTFTALFNLSLQGPVINNDTVVLKIPQRDFAFVKLKKVKESDYNFLFNYSFRKL